MSNTGRSSGTSLSSPSGAPSAPDRPPATAGGDERAPARSALAFSILAAGCGLGLLANGLLRADWGVNLLLWVAALVGTTLWIAHSGSRVDGHTPILLALVAVCFAGGLAIRDATELAVLNVGATLVTLVLLGMAVLGGPSPGIGVARTRDHVHAAVLLAWRTATGGFPLLLRDARIGALGLTTRTRVALGLLRGALLAMPLLIVFGALFMAADARFNDLVVNALGFDVEIVASHAAMIAFFGWITAGYLHGVLIEPSPAPIADLDEMSIGAVEAASVLALLDLLFAGFVAVQAQYLFGGGGIVEQTAGLTYALYAKRGFFELILATALVVPVLLAIDRLMRRESRRHERMFRWLAGLLALLVGLIMVSAAHRMRLYQDAYGMTESRLYASAFMVWIAIILVWFGCTVLRGAGRRFAHGAVVSGWLVLGGLNLIDPHRFVAQANLDRVKEGKSFDASYAGRLGGDAVPVLITALRKVDPRLVDWGGGGSSDPQPENSMRCRVRGNLLRLADGDEPEWRSWNLGHSRARQAARANRGLIESIECVEPARRQTLAPAPAGAPPVSGKGPAAP